MANIDIATNIKNAILEEFNICKPPVVDLRNQSSIIINCNAPKQWNELIYNSPQCINARNNPHLYTPEQICNACYVCCANDISQTMVSNIKISCITQDDFQNRLLNNIIGKLTSNLLSEETIKQIRDYLGTHIINAIQATTDQITNLQSININGTGVMFHIRQTIIQNILYNNIITDTLISDLNAIINPSSNLPDNNSPILPDNNLPKLEDSSNTNNNDNKNNVFLLTFIILISIIIIMVIIKNKKVKGGYYWNKL